MWPWEANTGVPSSLVWGSLPLLLPWGSALPSLLLPFSLKSSLRCPLLLAGERLSFAEPASECILFLEGLS